MKKVRILFVVSTFLTCITKSIGAGQTGLGPQAVLANALVVASPVARIEASLTETITMEATVPALQPPTPKTFALKYAPGVGAVYVKSTPQSSVPNSTTVTAAPGIVRPVAEVDISRAIRAIQGVTNVTMTIEHLNGRSTYKLAADTSNSLRCQVWVDAEYYYVSKSVIEFNAKTVLIVTTEYEKVSGLWLPKTIVLEHPVDGASITQAFTHYLIRT